MEIGGTQDRKLFFFFRKKKRQDRDSFEIFDDFDVIVWYKEHRYVSKKKGREICSGIVNTAFCFW